MPKVFVDSSTKPVGVTDTLESNLPNLTARFDPLAARVLKRVTNASAYRIFGMVSRRASKTWTSFSAIGCSRMATPS